MMELNLNCDEPDLDFAVPSTIKLVQVDYDTGGPSEGPNTVTEAFKVTNADASLIQPERYHNDEEDIASKINELDSSHEIY